jgi:uncharacterized protein involved in response to NO
MKTVPIVEQPSAAGPVPVSGPWRARWLLASPHRLGFFVGALMLALSALWWCVLMLLQHGLHVMAPWALSPGLAHGLWFGFGFMPSFFGGFLFTAGPKWMGLPPVSARVLLPSVAASLAGWGLFVIGAHRAAPLAAIGLAAVAWAWFAVVRRFGALQRASRVPDRVHVRSVLWAGVVGVLAMLACAAALLAGREDLARAALQLGLWGFVAPIFVTVMHRMVPFFGAAALPLLDAWRPLWLLWSLIGICLLQWPFALAEALDGPWPAGLRALQIAVESASAMLLLGLAVRWFRLQGLKLRLIAMLHTGVVWFGLAFALAAISHALLWASGGARSLGLAAQHAFAMGFLGSTWLAMATRVSSGQGGRPLAADDRAWALFLVLQAAVLLRVCAAIWPGAASALLMAASLAWLVAGGGWALRYGLWFGRPRVDGRPG